MAEGARKGPSLRADPVQQATPGTLFWILTNGVVRRGMPVWSKLPEPAALATRQLSQVTHSRRKISPLASTPSCDFRPSPRIKRQWYDNRLPPSGSIHKSF